MGIFLWSRAAILCLLTIAGMSCALAEETALDRYVLKPDANYAYELYHSEQDFAYTTYFIHLTSQQWRTAEEVDRPVWEHELEIVVPRVLHAPGARKYNALLIVNGGSNKLPLNQDATELLSYLAVLSGSVVAMVSQIPNQPLKFTDEINNPRREDEILAYSMDKFIELGDEEWPVHLAMTKAVVRTMDTVQEFLGDRSVEIDDFIVLGGSKRGWTSWLTGAVDDRVKAIVPISIDLLNMEPQFVHHWEAYGFYAPAITDYAEFDILCRMQTPRGQELLEIIDPFAYRERYTMPKMVINSAGDQFFVTDSSRFYFSDLPGPKNLRYTFNTDHSQGEDELQLVELITALLLWIEDVNKGQEAPDFDWTFESDGSIRVVTRDIPKQVNLVRASNPYARDFRLENIGAAWTRTELSDSGGGIFIGQVTTPAQGYTAFAIELIYEDVLGFGLTPLEEIYTTDVRITPDTLPFAQTACLTDRTIISGTVTLEGDPLCAMVLANGQHTFSCGGNPGWFQLPIPLDENKEATLFSFVDGLAPYRLDGKPIGLPLSVKMQRPTAGTPKPVMSVQRKDTEIPNRVEISGTIATVDNLPICAMVLANGQYMFSCKDTLGSFKLDVPPDTNNNVTVFGFADGFLPEKQIVGP